ncbi:hypothetical protein ACOSQ3_024338 [Xanthoceras sorbifolium]
MEEEEEQGGKLGEHSKLGGVTLLPPQTFLARKGPMGTVRCAAHLQHRLKKSQYTSTDISSTVGQSLEFQQHSEAPPCAISEEAFITSTGHSIDSSFTATKTKKAEEKDENRIIKKGFGDASDLLWKRRNMPNSALGL